jgi:hypothetical protein
MKKHILLLGLTILLTINAISQSCLPEGIYIRNQEDIDNFQINYPNCTDVEGFVDISDSHNTIENLNGLSSIETIGGYLRISSIDVINFSGLDNLQTVGGYLSITSNDYITDLTGLDNLTTIDGNLDIKWNDSLSNCRGLEYLTSLGGNLIIDYNNSLTTLAGIQNIDTLSIANLTITNNALLNTCNISSICSYLTNPNGAITIYDNAIGCNNLLEIADSCGVVLPCLPYGNYFFMSQNDIDDFTINYPNCNELQGNIYIYGNTIENLIGLNSITSIAGDLRLSIDTSQTTSLTNLVGLDNLTTIGGTLQILNQPGLTDLSGLESLNYINGGLDLGYNPNLENLSGLENLNSAGWLEIWVNYSLTSLTGLEGVTTLDGELSIFTNPLLTSLKGISNIDAASIQGVYLRYNTSLSKCNVESICNYLISPNTSTSFWYNTTGCNSKQEVIDSCGIVSCLPNGITFTTQEEVDDFQVNYPNCNFIEGDVTISGFDITDISSLNSILSINGNLAITDCESLADLSGLSALIAVDGDLIIGNSSKGGNPSLLSLSGLDQLFSIDGELIIENNSVLSDITSLENIISSTITGLHINNNIELSICSIESICEYITTSDSVVDIYNNSQGCNNELEVLSACVTMISDNSKKEIFTIFPNPATNNIDILNKYKLEVIKITIYNQMGQKLIESKNISEKVDISELDVGIYIVEIVSGKLTQRHKLIVSK